MENAKERALHWRKERQHYEAQQKNYAERSGPRDESDVGDRDSDQQGWEQRARRISEQYTGEEHLDDSGKHRH